jgi:hypothetical protein
MLPIDYYVLAVIAACAVVLFTRFAPPVLRYIVIILVFLCGCFCGLGLFMLHRLAWDQPKRQHFGPDAPEHRYFADGAFAAQNAAARSIPGMLFSAVVLTGAALQGVSRSKGLTPMKGVNERV